MSENIHNRIAMLLGNTLSVVEDLQAFRTRLHSCFGKRTGSLFELCDALLTAGTVPSPPHLSLAPIHRRGWGSLYAALSKGRLDQDALRGLVVGYPLEDDERKGAPPVYAEI